MGNKAMARLLAHRLAARPANSINESKTQLPERLCYAADTRLPRMFQHPKDVTAVVTRIQDNKRARWKEEAAEDLPPTRVYDLASEVPRGADSPGLGGAVVGDIYRPSLSVITRKSKRGLWKYGTAQ